MNKEHPKYNKTGFYILRRALRYVKQMDGLADSGAVLLFRLSSIVRDHERGTVNNWTEQKLVELGRVLGHMEERGRASNVARR